MAQVCTVIQADPATLATHLAALGEQVLIVEKTKSAGKFVVISESPSTSQQFEVIAGDPESLSTAIQNLIDVGVTIDLIIPTFSAAHYVVVYT